MVLPTLPDWMSFERLMQPPAVVAVVPLTGLIGHLGPWHRGLSLRGLAPTLERAFTLKHVKAVALAVNSPGGSPVQAALIGRRIRDLAEEHSVPVFAFAEDVAASGGYWLLTAADEIYADACSIIGSIGVVSAGFGFPEMLKRLGVERRLYASGEHKAGLDPFQPEKPEEVAHLKQIQAEIHEVFRNQVRARRGARLTGAEDEVFSGRFWSGGGALALGLIDGLGDVRTVMRARYGKDVRLRLIGDGRRWWQRRFGLLAGGAPAAAARCMDARAVDGRCVGGGLVDDALSALTEHLAWQRFRP